MTAKRPNPHWHERRRPTRRAAAPAMPVARACGAQDAAEHDVETCGEACEYNRTIGAMLAALDAHAEAAGCARAFYVPDERADCVCAACGTVVYEGPEFEPDA